MSDARTITGLLLLAAVGGVGVYLYSRSQAQAGISVVPAGATAQAAAFSSPVFQIAAQAAAANASQQDAGGVDHPFYGGASDASYALYDPAYHNATITTTNLLSPVSNAALKTDLQATGAGQVASASFFDVLSGIGSLFGAPPATAAPATGVSSVVLSHDVDTLARTIWGEARNESQAGMEAVANVVVNRSRKSPKWNWPKGIAAVCTQAYQFSCWNVGDPNRPLLLKVTTADAKFRTCVSIAQRAVAGTLADRTRGADHYYADYIATPSWAKGVKPTVTIGRHIFLNLVG